VGSGIKGVIGKEDLQDFSLHQVFPSRNLGSIFRFLPQLKVCFKGLPKTENLNNKNKIPIKPNLS
jgi:hypothetical protein